MPIDYAVEQRVFSRFKGALTRALKTKDPDKIIAAVDAFNAYYQQPGKVFPDDWARWERAKDDAEYEKRRLTAISRNWPPW